MRLRLLLAASLLAPAWCLGQEMRLCVDRYPHLPFLSRAGGGTVGTLVHAAAQRSGVTIRLHAAPVARCRVEIERGLADAYPMAPYMAELASIAAYPMHAGQPDRTRSVMVARMMLFRPAGSNVAWDGKQITGLRSKVLVGFSSPLLTQTLTAQHVPIDQQGRSMAINFAKLLAGRGDAVGGFESEGRALMAQPAFAGKIEMLPLPLVEATYYMVVSKPYYARNSAAVERMWQQIGSLNKAAEAQEE